MDASPGQGVQTPERLTPTPWRMYALIGMFGIAATTMVAYGLHLGASTVTTHTRLMDAAMEIQLEATTAHLWFEEVIAGDSYLDIRIVRDHLARADWHARTMLEGGTSSEGLVTQLDSAQLRWEIEAARQKLAEFRRITEARFDTIEESSIGSPIDQRYDALFADLVAQTGQVETELRALLAQDLGRFQSTQVSLLVACGFCTVLVGLGFRRLDRTRAIVSRSIIDANESLAAEVASRKRAGEALRIAEQRYRAVVEDSPVLVCRFLPGTEITYVNGAYCEYFGKTPEELTGSSFLSLIPETNKEAVMADITALTAESPTQSHEHEVMAPDGEIRWQRWTNHAVFDAQGEVVAYQSIGEDITQRKQAEETSRRFEYIVSCSGDMLALLDENFVYLAVNATYVRAFAMTSDKVVGRTVAEVFGQEFFSTVIKPRAERCLAGEDIRYQDWFDFPVIGRRYMDIAYSPYIGVDARIQGFVVAGRDITERKRAEDDLRQRTHDLRERLKELNCLYAISALAEQPNITLEDIIQGTVDAIPSSWQHPEVTSARITLDDKAYYTPHFRESPWQQVVEITAQEVPIGSVEVFYSEDLGASDEGPFLKEERKLIIAITERLGKIVQRIRLEEDREALKEQLYQAQKMEAVAQLAGGIAHDFHNLLTVIGWHVGLAKKAIPIDHQASVSLRSVQEAAEQAAGVTRSLMAFSHRAESKMGPVVLQNMVKRSFHLFRHILPAGIEVAIDTSPEPVWIHADETQLRQIVMNLVINARDAMPGGGTLSVSVSESARASKQMEDLGGPDGSVARLTVSDTGEGMEPSVRKRVFEPFFTTKPKGQGTGLGLSIVHSIVEDHGGNILVGSEPGRGTTFTVELPLLETEPSHNPHQDEAPLRQGHGEVVLLAQGNRQVRGILTSVLESQSYEILPVSDGNTLMARFDRDGKRIDLLVFDVDLPKRSGIDCLRDIRSKGGSVPAIVITGGTAADLEKRIDDNTTLLRKPFLIGDFSKLVGNLLAASPQPEEPNE